MQVQNPRKDTGVTHNKNSYEALTGTTFIRIYPVNLLCSLITIGKSSSHYSATRVVVLQ